MNISKTSLHAKIYKTVYGDRFPNNLCPYFWKMVLSLIIIIPLLLISLPKIILDKINKNESEPLVNAENWGGGFGIYIALFAVFTMIYCWFFPFRGNDLASIGYAIWIGIGIVTLGISLAKLIDMYRERNKEKNPSIVSEFIKAKKNKYCPKINWIE